jgi:hypothetical protein
MAAVRLIIVLALAAIEAGVYLRSYSNSLPSFNESDLGSNAESRADNFCFSRQHLISRSVVDTELTMADAEREFLLSPTSTDRMQITGADTARLDLNINIVITKGLRLKLIEVKLGPFLRILNLEAFEGVWVNHFD